MPFRPNSIPTFLTGEEKEDEEPSWWDLFKATWTRERAEMAEFGTQMKDVARKVPISMASPNLSMGDLVDALTPKSVENLDEDVSSSIKMVAEEERSKHESVKDKFLGRRDLTPVGAALAETGARGLSMVTGPEEAIPGGVGYGAIKSLGKKALQEGIESVAEAGLKTTVKSADDVPVSTAKVPEILSKETPKSTLQNPWDMSVDEIEEAIRRTKEDTSNVEASLFGEEGAARYKALQRKQNAFDPKIADAATKELDAMEATLTEEELNKLYGINEEIYDVDELKDFYSAATDAFSWGAKNPQELGQSLQWAITDLPDGIVDPAQMNYKGQLAYTKIKSAYEYAVEQGWDTAEVSAAALEHAAKRFSDPEDAAFILNKFHTQAKNKPAQKQITAGEAMQHANDAVSPEAINRMKQVEIFRVRNSGEVIPVTGVDAIDVRPNKNEMIIQVNPDGSTTHLHGSVSSPEARKALRRLREEGTEPFKIRVEDDVFDGGDGITYFLDSGDGGGSDFVVIDSTPPGFGKVKTFDAVDPDTGLVLGELETFSPLSKGYTITKAARHSPKEKGVKGFTTQADATMIRALENKAEKVTGGPRLKQPKRKYIAKDVDPKTKRKEDIPQYVEDPVRGVVAVKGKLKAWARRNLFEQGTTADIAARFKGSEERAFFRRTVPNILEKQKNEQRALEFELLQAQKTLEGEIKFAAKDLGVTQDYLRKKMYLARTIHDDEGLNFLTTLAERAPKLYDAYLGSNRFIDTLTQRFIDEGVVKTKEEVETLRANFGQYLHRTYEASGDSKWFDKMKGTAEYDRLYEFIAHAHPDYTDEQIVARMQKYISNVTQDVPEMLKQSKSITRQNLKELERRRNLPQEVLDFLKVYDDYAINAEQTSMLLVKDLTLQRMYNSLAEKGNQLGIFRFASDGGRFSTKLVGNIGPLDGMYTHPDIARFIRQVDEQTTTSLFAYLSGLEKFAKVGYSHGTQLRNFESGFFMTLANGRIPMNPLSLAHAARGQMAQVSRLKVKNFMKAFGAANEKEFLDSMTDMYRRGIIGRGAYSGDFEVYMRDIASRSATEWLSKNKMSQFVGRLYKAGDDFWKAYNYQQEVKRLQWIKGADGDIEAIKDEAAEIIAQQMQTYDRTPEMFRKLSRNPVVSPFATFYAEMPRNIVNILKRSAHEYRMAVKTNNWKYAASATSRVGGIVSALGVWAGIENYTSAKNGLDEADQEALRYFYPHYMENARAPVLSVDGTDITVLNTDYVNPYGIIDNIMTAMLRPGDFGEKMTRVAEEIGEQFASPELLTRAAVETATGSRLGPKGIGTAGEIYNEATPNPAGKLGYHLYRTTAPGSVTSGENWLRGAGILNKQDPRFPWREYDFVEETISQFGPRMMTIDIDKAVGSYIGRFSAFTQDVNREYETLLLQKDPNAVEKMEEQWKKEYLALQKAVFYGRQLGVTDDSIIASFEVKGNPLRKALKKKLMNGEYVSFSEWKKIKPQDDSTVWQSLSPTDKAKILDAFSKGKVSSIGGR